jgi:hypothetical protein
MNIQTTSYSHRGFFLVYLVKGHLCVQTTDFSQNFMKNFIDNLMGIAGEGWHPKRNHTQYTCYNSLPAQKDKLNYGKCPPR